MQAGSEHCVWAQPVLRFGQASTSEVSGEQLMQHTLNLAVYA